MPSGQAGKTQGPNTPVKKKKKNDTKIKFMKIALVFLSINLPT